MLRSLIAIVALLSLSAIAQDFEVTPFEVNPDKGGVRVTVQVRAPKESTFEGKIRVPVEGVLLNANATQQLNEADVFGSGLKLDMNGDGDTDDSFGVRQEGSKKYLGEVQVRPFTESVSTQNTGQAQVYTMASDGPGFLVYQADQYNIVAGADHHGVKAGFRECPNPFYQVILIEPCEQPSGPPVMSLEGADSFAYAWEPAVFSDGHSWMRVQWLALPVGTPQSFRITGKGHGFLVGRVNFSVTPGVRERREPEVIPFAIPYDL